MAMSLMGQITSKHSVGLKEPILILLREGGGGEVMPGREAWHSTVA